MSSNSGNAEEEKHGPRVGVTLDLKGANLILKRHLSQPCKSFQEVKRGFNNRTYIVTTALDDATYVIRLSGIHWTKIKTEGEVAAIVYLRFKCPEIPVPKIYGYCSDKDLSGIGHEYILMEHLPGVPLDEIFFKISFEEQKQILEQIAKTVAAMKAIQFNKIGSFCFLPKVSKTSGLDPKVFTEIQLTDISIGKTVDQGIGPFDTYLEYFRALCSSEIEQLKKCKFMEPQMRNLGRIEHFLDVISGLSGCCPLPETVLHPEFVFMHGDFEPRNILVSRTMVTGLLDLEFSGSFPIDNEWYDGFMDFGASTKEWNVFDEEPAEDAPSDPEMIKPIREYFLSACQRSGARIPEEMAGHLQRAELHYFATNICPWYLREIRDDIPAHWPGERELALKRVETVLSKYGC